MSGQPLVGGVETGGTWCVCAIGSGPGEIRDQTRFRTSTPEETIAGIAAFFTSDPDARPAAVGVGGFGPLDLDPRSPTWGSVTTTPKPGWQDVPLAPQLQERLGVPIVIDTDVNAAAVAEHRWGAGRAVSSLCYLTIGTGIGAGIVVDGRPVHGLVHPEVGHIRIPHDLARDPFPGSCVAHGDCWEGLASGFAMGRRWEVSAETLADDHPAWVLEADYLALGILAIVCVASPEMVICGGGVMEHEGMVEMVRTRLRDLVGGYLRTPLLGPEIDHYLVTPALGDDAGVLGAMALARDIVAA
jgi:fructokinase